MATSILRQPYRIRYVAETPGADKQLILIKFVRRYSTELHQICAKSGHAPLILTFEQLPGGWFAVAMEYIESGIPITQLSCKPYTTVPTLGYTYLLG
jgi:hypothetical protein